MEERHPVRFNGIAIGSQKLPLNVAIEPDPPIELVQRTIHDRYPWVQLRVERTIPWVSGQDPKQWFLDRFFDFWKAEHLGSAILWRRSVAELWQRYEVVAEIFSRAVRLVQHVHDDAADRLRPELKGFLQRYLLDFLNQRLPHRHDIDTVDVGQEEMLQLRIVQEAAQECYGREVVKLLHAQKLLSKNVPLAVLKAWIRRNPTDSDEYQGKLLGWVDQQVGIILGPRRSVVVCGFAAIRQRGRRLRNRRQHRSMRRASACLPHGDQFEFGTRGFAMASDGSHSEASDPQKAQVWHTINPQDIVPHRVCAINRATI